MQRVAESSLLYQEHRMRQDRHEQEVVSIMETPVSRRLREEEYDGDNLEKMASLDRVESSGR